MASYMRRVLFAVLCCLCLTILSSCGSRTNVEPLKHDFIAQYTWSSNSDLALTIDTDVVRHQEDIVTSSGTQLSVSHYCDGDFGWSPDGRYLLYQEGAAEPMPNGLFFSRLMAYDMVINRSFPLTDTPEAITSACWTSQNSFVYSVRLLSITQSPATDCVSALYTQGIHGKPHLLAQSPTDLVPIKMFYNAEHQQLRVMAVYFSSPSADNNFLYVVSQGKFIPIALSSGYNRTCSYSAARSIMAVEREDLRSITHGIDIVDFKAIPPTITPLITDKQLPHDAQLSDMNFSPDGTKLVYSAARSGQLMSIYLYDLLNKHINVIGEGIQPSFTPDGKSISFIGSHITGKWHTPSLSVFVCTLDGHDTHEIHTGLSPRSSVTSVTNGSTIILTIITVVIGLVALWIIITWQRQTKRGRA